MPAKKNTQKNSKSSASRSTQLTQFTFKWWMALVLVGIVAVVGVVIVRFSNAAGPFAVNDTAGNPHTCSWSSGSLYCTNIGSSTVYVPIGVGKNPAVNYFCKSSHGSIDTYAGKAYLCYQTGG